MFILATILLMLYICILKCVCVLCVYVHMCVYVFQFLAQRGYSGHSIDIW